MSQDRKNRSGALSPPWCGMRTTPASAFPLQPEVLTGLSQVIRVDHGDRTPFQRFKPAPNDQQSIGYIWCVFRTWPLWPSAGSLSSSQPSAASLKMYAGTVHLVPVIIRASNRTVSRRKSVWGIECTLVQEPHRTSTTSRGAPATPKSLPRLRFGIYDRYTQFCCQKPGLTGFNRARCGIRTKVWCGMRTKMLLLSPSCMDVLLEFVFLAFIIVLSVHLKII